MRAPLKCFLLIVLVLVPASVYALSYPVQQGHVIEGVVVDQKGDPVSAAVVTISGANVNTTTSTDDDGRFQIQSPVESALTVQITAAGFETITQKVDRPASNSANLRFVLTPAPVTGQVTVTATRTETRLEDSAASLTVLGETQLETTAALTLDDSLRQVPGFSLFRRSGSRTANPTTQGVSLRGLGASGASRAVVFADGLPLNDPFGAWVYWDRVPRAAIAQVEVLSGPASHLYGSGALGGIVNIKTKGREATSALLDLSYGNETTPNASLFASGRRNDWGASVAAEIFNTDGYVLVAPDERGPVDTAAGARHSVISITGERWFGPMQHVFGSMSFFGESRKNGTPLQTNRTHIRQFSFGGEVVSVRRGSISFRTYGGTQVYDQNFSAVNDDRTSEVLTRIQRVPAQFEGFLGQWSSPEWHNQRFVAGYETQAVRGASDEIVFVNGRASSIVGAGGRERRRGLYFEDLITIGSKLFLNAGVRLDHWSNHRALSATTPLTPGASGTVIEFPDRSETALSPQLSGVFKFNSHVSLLFSVARAFRAPTLNELYRAFRVGNVLTLANENLLAERLTGGEAGIRVSALRDTVVIRGSAFWNAVTRPVANVTLQTTPVLITRQRQTLGRTRSSGLDVAADARVHRFWTISAGYLLADAVVEDFPANRALEGLKIPQIPMHQFTFQLQYANPSRLTVGIQGRAASSQFDDDQNVFKLGSYFVMDALVSRRISSRLDLFGAAENVFNQRYEVGKTPVTTVGPPVLVRAGVRVRLGEK